jgi:hypothetical protein
MRPRQDLTGQVFGRLTVLEFVRMRNEHSYYLCRCECGATTIVTRCSLVHKAQPTRSCGCLQRESVLTGPSHPNFRHGRNLVGKKDLTYTSWNHTKARCTNPKHKNWKLYGGANPPVTICERWLDFRNFLADMGDRPLGTTLGRFGDVGNYEPGNCAWQTPKEQASNRRNKRIEQFSDVEILAEVKKRQLSVSL